MFDKIQQSTGGDGGDRAGSRIQEVQRRAVARWLSRSSVTYDGSGLARARLWFRIRLRGSGRVVQDETRSAGV